MRIIKTSTVRAFGVEHTGASIALERWLDVAGSARWRMLRDVRQTFRAADEVRVASGRTVVVFNIGGNRFRLVTAIHYNLGKVFVLRFMTHAEYSRDRWKDDL